MKYGDYSRSQDEAVKAEGVQKVLLTHFDGNRVDSNTKHVLKTSRIPFSLIPPIFGGTFRLTT